VTSRTVLLAALAGLLASASALAEEDVNYAAPQTI
jgi:hypothetical protein